MGKGKKTGKRIWERLGVEATSNEGRGEKYNMGKRFRRQIQRGDGIRVGGGSQKLRGSEAHHRPMAFAVLPALAVPAGITGRQRKRGQEDPHE